MPMISGAYFAVISFTLSVFGFSLAQILPFRGMLGVMRMEPQNGGLLITELSIIVLGTLRLRRFTRRDMRCREHFWR